jgi:hypothetical protein
MTAALKQDPVVTLSTWLCGSNTIIMYQEQFVDSNH